MRIPSFFKSFSFFGLALVMLTLSVVEARAQQKVYASSYGWEHSGLSLLPVILSSAEVLDPENGIMATESNFTRLYLLGVAGVAYARYQLKFPQHLPAGTSVFFRVQSNRANLLGLLLASKKNITIQKAAVSNLPTQISGTNIDSSQFSSVVTSIEGKQFVVLTPNDSFNAITVFLDPAGLNLLGIPLAPSGQIDVYYAYYECPTITVSQQEPACAGHPFTLAVDNPINTNYTWYPTNSTANPLGTGNTITLTEATATTKNYYLKHNQFSATCGLDTVTVNIGAIPDNPAVSLE